MQQTKTAIVWFTNNLRVYDNKVLHDACIHYDRVIAAYCFNPNEFETTQFGFKKTEKFRAQFLIESINNLAENLKKHNISFFLSYEHPHVLLPEICLTHKADALYVQKEFTDEELKTINKVKNKLPESTEVVEIYDQFLYHPADIPFNERTLPEVFTNFRKKVEKYGNIQEETLSVMKSRKDYIEFEYEAPTLSKLGFNSFSKPVNTAFPFKGGENAAKERLNEYFFESKKLAVYKKTRNGLIGTNYSSKFSSWLANGSISARTIYWEVKKFEAEFGSNQSTYWLIFELIWRDYFKFLSLKHQNKLFKVTGIKDIEYDWKVDQKLIDKWIQGETNEPFVNANMIELQKTGWMSNRGRQNVASYFAKNLLLDWRIGAAYFESMLIDYDVHSNYGNWQYVAGVGNDPRDRKFNVKLQAERYDSKGAYQSMWLQPTLF